MQTVTESIFNGTSIVPLAEVQHIETRPLGVIDVIMKSSTWNQEADCFNNSIHFAGDEAKEFIAAFCAYRAELEADTLTYLGPPTERVRNNQLTETVTVTLEVLISYQTKEGRLKILNRLPKDPVCLDYEATGLEGDRAVTVVPGSIQIKPHGGI